MTEKKQNQSSKLSSSNISATASAGGIPSPDRRQNDRWFTAWQVVSEDKSVALVQLVLLAPRANAPVLSVRLRGLQEDAVYEDDGGTRYTGAALMKAGLALPPMARGLFLNTN